MANAMYNNFEHVGTIDSIDTHRKLRIEIHWENIGNYRKWYVFLFTSVSLCVEEIKMGGPRKAKSPHFCIA